MTALRGAIAVLVLVQLAPASAGATVTVEVPPDRSRVEAIAEAVRDETLRALESAPNGRVAIRVRRDLPERAPRGEALAQALVAPTLAALRAASGRFTAVDELTQAAEASLRAGYAMAIDYRVRAVGNYLYVDVAILFSGRAAPPPRFDVRSRLDLELRGYVGALDRVSENTVVARAVDLPGSGYLAMIAADLDADGASELVVITAGRVQVLRLGAARVGVRLVPVVDAAIPRDLVHAPSPTRRPLATGVATERAVVARLSDRTGPLRIELANGSLRISAANGPCAALAFPIDGGCAQLVEGRDFFDDALVHPGAEPASHDLPGHFYAYAQARVRTPEGTVMPFEAIVTPLGRLSVRIGDRTNGAVGYGTALAMSDLDEDGAPEMLLSSARATGAGDQLTMLRALPRGALHVVWRSEELTGSVWLAARGDLDGDGLAELLAIEEPREPGRARLWIVR